MGKERYGNITKSKLDEELNDRLGEGKYSTNEVEEGIVVAFTKSTRTYLVDSDGNVTEDITKATKASTDYLKDQIMQNRHQHIGNHLKYVKFYQNQQ